MSATVAIKDPSEVKGYTFDFTPWLDDLGVTISSVSSITPDSGITVLSSSNTTKTVTSVMSGGTDGVDYKVKVAINTSNGYLLIGSLTIPVQSK